MIAATAIVITMIIAIVISACYKATSIETKNSHSKKINGKIPRWIKL